MIINEINNQSITISSLNKIYNSAKINGKLDSVNLYILNIIFKLLSGCCVGLTHYEKQRLMEMYRKIYFRTDVICKNSFVEPYKYTKPKFVQAESEDCNSFTKFPKIYYWQELDYNTISNDIFQLIDDTGYFITKPFDSYKNFEIGKTITYSNYGKIVFLATETLSTDMFTIKDILNINVNDSFTKTYNNVINSTLFVSKNNYSYGDINFKIIKL